MLRTLSGLLAVSALALLGGAASAGASIPSDYGDLAHKQLKPAALVPTTAPKDLSPLSVHLGQFTGVTRKGYLLRVRDGNKAIIALERGRLKSVAAAVKEGRGAGVKIRSIRVRSRAGKLFTSPRGRPTFFTIVWEEKGALYELSTGTTRTISLRELLSFAKGLQPLEREYVTTVCNAGYCQGAIVVTTPKTASVLVEWEAQCNDPNGIGQEVLGNKGSVVFSLLPRSGANFSFGLAPRPGQPWTIAGGGAISPAAVALNFRATGTPKGEPCDTGQLALNVDQRFAD